MNRPSTKFSFKGLAFISLLCSLFLVACSQEDQIAEAGSGENIDAIFKLHKENYTGATSRTSADETDGYDEVFFFITDADGNTIRNLKSFYKSSTSEIYIEGLRKGNYDLMVLGIKGNKEKDHATVYSPNHIDEKWLSFPDNLEKPLEAEYFYSKTPFTITETPSADGLIETVTIKEDVRQKRIVGRVDFNLSFNNPYVRTSIVTTKVQLAPGVCFATTFSGNGEFSGSSNGAMAELTLDNQSDYLFMPLTPGSSLSGNIDMYTLNYRHESAHQKYDFQLEQITPNHIHDINTSVKHPDDKSGVMFLSRQAYDEGNHGEILSDDEPKEVYTNQTLRKFNTSRPLQVSVTDNGELHVRFYSPRKLTNTLIKMRLPSVSDEFFDFAYFDSIPAFCDFYQEIPVLKKKLMFTSASGKHFEIGPISTENLKQAEFMVESNDPYWTKLQDIKHGWNIYWGLYGGNPDTEDGSPSGNWMGIRPLHCRESVALFLNFTYMIDMKEHEEILYENADILYDDNKNPVKVEQVLEQMRQARTLQVGLVYTGNGVLGLGGGTVFGAYQRGWFEHYFNTYACSVMFHELGHVMGYGHSSSFTYGPWAERLMNNFYVDNLSKLPIDSPDYLNSRNNPHQYK